MLIVHGTKKLRDRLKGSAPGNFDASTTKLGDWYATALFWRPHVALFTNEATLLPVLVPLAPAADLLQRFVPALAAVLAAHGAPTAFVEAETAQMEQIRLTKTSNRSVVGVMNEFTYLAEAYRADRPPPDLVDLSLHLAETPCGPLYDRHVSPDRELAALLAKYR